MQDSEDKERMTDEVQREKTSLKKSGLGQIFRTRPDRPWGPPSFLYNGYRVPLLGVNLPGSDVNYPPSSSAEVEERVLPLWAFMACFRVIFTFIFYRMEKSIINV